MTNGLTMKYIIACSYILFSLHSFSQSADPAAFAGTITPEDLRNHMLVIAGDSMMGRETATEGQRRAAYYIEQYFRKTGLKAAFDSSYQQSFPVYRDSVVKSSFEVNGKLLKTDTDFSVSTNSSSDISLSSEQVLFVGYGLSDSIWNDYRNIDAKGKIVMVLPGTPPAAPNKNRSNVRVTDHHKIQQAAMKNGAAALLIFDPGFPRTAHHTKSGMYVNEGRHKNTPNTYFISQKVARQIMGKDFAAVRKSMKTKAPQSKTYPAKIKIQLEKITQQLESTNVLGMIEGTDKKDEALIITSHYDHLGVQDSVIYYGADDDGSGTVTILELAEAFNRAANAGHRPRRNIIFMTVSGEEKGLWGSDFYSKYPAFPLEKTTANINIDMIGRIESGREEDSLNYIFVVGDNRLSSDLRKISEEANNKYTRLNLDYKFNDPADPQRIYYRSDHYNFAKNGVPAIFYFSGLHEDYHRPTDTPDKIRYELLAKRAQLIFYTAWEMANRDEMLKRDKE
jgi:hypothetical protein